jgi:hypothetical protein
LEGLKKGFLNRVLGILPVVRDVLRDSEEFAIVALHEFLESGNIPFLLAWTRSRSSLATVLTANCAESAVIFVQGAGFLGTIDAARNAKSFPL